MKRPPHIKDIDLDRLEWECVKQERLAGEINECLEDAKFQLEIAETKMDVVKADLSLKIRSKPKRYGLKSVTEKAIEALLILQSEYKQQKWRCLRLRHKVGIFNAASKRIEHRKRMIEKAIDLWTYTYFSRPRVKKEAHEKFDIAQKRAVRGSDD